MKRALIGAMLALGLSTLVSAAPQWTKAELGKVYVVFQHSTLEMISKDYMPVREEITGKISLSLARGEYKSAQLGIHVISSKHLPSPRADLSNVRLEIETDLDVRIYRTIDGKVRQMLLEGPNPVVSWIHGSLLDESNELALIEKGTSSFFWLTLHAGKDTVPGKHHGRITIKAEGDSPGAQETELELEVTVRPFELQRARIAYAPFFYMNWGPGPLPKFTNTDAWTAAIFRDMAEHSHTSVIGLGYSLPGAHIDTAKVPPPVDNRTFNFLLPLAKETGLTSPDIPVFHMGNNLTVPEYDGGTTVEQKNKFADWYETERQKQGWPELISYGIDEPQHPNPGFRKRYRSFRDVRMRLGTAQSAPAAYGLGDMDDVWIVVGGEITPEMSAEAQRLGAEVWTYICAPLSYKPLLERHYAGLYCWAHRVKGHTTWHYYAQTAYKLVWFREGDKRPMPLAGWETRREGIDDYRYLQMLEDSVAAKAGSPIAAEAQKWMDGLRARIAPFNPHKTAPGKPLELAEYDRIREQAADYILQLGVVPADRIPSRIHARLKDEAKLFRGKPVQECVAGLSHRDAAVRRAATWALFEIAEKGDDASAAVSALAKLLDDAEVRMPALRTLEVIGPASLPAVPQLIKLLKHPDGFVRMGAVYASGATGATGDPLLKALIPVVKDEYNYAAQIAGRTVSAMGPAALPALPALIEMLDGPAREIQQPALKAIAGIGPAAAAAVPHILRNWPGRNWMPGYLWVEPLAAIGPGAKEAVPMLEQFRKDRSARAQRYRKNYSIDATALNALYRIRRSPEDLRELVDLIGGVGGGPRDAGKALAFLEKLGKDAKDAAPQVRELLAKGSLSDEARKRLEGVLRSMAGK